MVLEEAVHVRRQGCLVTERYYRRDYGHMDVIDPYGLTHYRAGLGRQKDVDALLAHWVRMIAKLDRALLAQARALGWSESIARCRAIPGIGPLTALAFVGTWHRGAFANVDSFIAFLGLDVRVRQSGRWQGRRKLTKKGDGEIRRLLFNAAIQGRRNPLWAPYYLRLRVCGIGHRKFSSAGMTQYDSLRQTRIL
jgi:transposase